MTQIEAAIAAYVSFMWGLPLVILLVGGGFFFMLHSQLRHFRYFRHSIDLLRGKFHDDSDSIGGDISHFLALATALAGTMGLGNITGVAVALTVGGPGAIFWMWVTAIVGISTKFYTATLSILYRGTDEAGRLQGGPMYIIREGLGRKWLPLAWLFAIAGMVGTLPVFQVNQLVQIIRDTVRDSQWADYGGFAFQFRFSDGHRTRCDRFFDYSWQREARVGSGWKNGAGDGDFLFRGDLGSSCQPHRPSACDAVAHRDRCVQWRGCLWWCDRHGHFNWRAARRVLE